MPSRLFSNICSFFYRQPTKRKEAYSFRTNRVFGDWATSAVEDVPPPYTDSPECKTLSTDGNNSPPPPFASPRLQICSHESLSFEELQRTVHSLAISGTDETINALTLSCREHQSQIDPATGNARSICTSSPGLLRGFGTYASESSNDPSHAPSIVLCFHWNLGFLDGIRGQVETALELQQFLGVDGIWLCPHKQISDSDVINAVFGFVKTPLGQEVITSCIRCDTEIKIKVKMEGGDETCRVTTKRCLGTLKKPEDPTWLTQCGV